MSLKIEKKVTDGHVLLALTGRLDTATAPELEATLEPVLAETSELTFDLSALEYISSAGLRVILKAQKAMSRQGSMKLVHVPESVMEVFDITGFVDFLTIEN